MGNVWKTAFATIAGTYVSHIMQQGDQGDCNAPAIFQWLMTSIFRDVIGKFLHVYLNNIFVHSETPEEHEAHLCIIFKHLRNAQLYLKWLKCDLYADQVDCGGYIIDKDGIHADTDKLAHICEWHTPQSYNDIQCFEGLVNYLASFLPDITHYTGPLLAMTQNGIPFHWQLIHQLCFDMVKRICCKIPVITPIDPKHWDKPIWCHICSHTLDFHQTSDTPWTP